MAALLNFEKLAISINIEGRMGRGEVEYRSYFET